MGTFNTILLVRFERMSTSLGKIELYAGISNTSSKVRPSPNNLEFAEPVLGELFLIAMCKDTKMTILLPNQFFVKPLLISLLL
jgi:hypothetical protein